MVERYILFYYIDLMGGDIPATKTRSILAMPKIIFSHKDESGADVFSRRKAAIFSRIEALRARVLEINPPVKDQVTISQLDCILKSLDDAYHVADTSPSLQ